MLRKLLIVRLGSLGDIVHTVPAQQEIRRHLRDAEIHWLTEPPYASFLQCVPGISRIWMADTQKWRRSMRHVPDIVRLVRSLRRQRFDAALDFQGLVKSASLARFSGARRTIGLAPDRFREPASRYFYSEAVNASDGSRLHVIQTNLQLARHLGCPVNGARPNIPLDIPPEADRYVDQLLDRAGMARPVLVNPGAGWETKRWPPEQYGRLCSLIQTECALPVAITFGPKEESLAREVCRHAAPQAVLQFPTNLLQLAALFRKSRLLVAGDTGPLHLAVALALPTVAILGPTSARRNGPFNQEDIVVKRDLPCSNSYRRTCDQFICMDIPVEQVFEAVKRRLA